MIDTPKPPEFVTTYYVTEERAMAPGIAGTYDVWPNIIPAPHTKNGRLSKLPKEFDAELAELRAYKTAYLEAMKIVSGVQMAFNRGDSRRETLFRFVQTEIESGRFKP